MKKILLLFITLSSGVIAQPVLTATGINPVVSEMYVFDFNSAVSPGNSGANQNWVLMPSGTNTTNICDTYLPSSTPYASSFMQANFCSFDGNSYAYSKTSPLVLRQYGYASPSFSVSYSDPEDVLRFPFSVGNTYTDTWASTNSANGTRTATSTVTYDAYGSLTLPSGTYNNVVRVHYSQVFHDSPTVGPGSVYVFNNELYAWYANGYHQPLATTFTMTNNSNGSILYEGSVILSNMVSSISQQDNISSIIKSYPNPAVNEINFDLSNIDIHTIDIINIEGKIIYKNVLSQSIMDKILTINTTDFKDGIYFAKFTTMDGQTETKKISILK
ncbi:MAG: T9SS type A sorting domain-containing protein [Bacteroidota bacterium]